MLRYSKPKSADVDQPSSFTAEPALDAESIGLNQIVSLPELPTDTVEVQFQGTKEYYVMGGNKTKTGQSQGRKFSSEGKRLGLAGQYETEEESPAKKIKLDLQRSNTAGTQSKLGAETRNYEFTGNRWSSLPVQTSVSSPFASKSNSSRASRDMSKLPSEESSSSTSQTYSAKAKTSHQTTLPFAISDVPQELTPDQKYKAMLMWQKIRAENLDCDYVKVFGKREGDKLFQELENTLTYFTGDLAQIKIFGKRVDIPRKQVAHGDEGVTYTYSGVKISAKPWTPVLNQIKEKIQEVTQHSFNFVLINRYEDGNHYMGEHRDDEKELRHGAPIASVSLGSTRDFVFRHTDSRGMNAKRKIPPIKLQLEHGSLLVMKYPTNVYWYHALPVRRKSKLPRINLTFRDIVTKK